MQRALVGMGWVGLAAALIACGGADTSSDRPANQGSSQRLGGRGGGGAGGSVSSSGMNWGEPVQPTAMAGRPMMTMDPKKCTSVTLNASRITPTVMLLVDGSGSMQDNFYPPDSMTTRWSAVRTALIDMTMGVVPQLQGLVKFGLAVYGTGPFDPFAQGPSASCPLPVPVIQPALTNYPMIMNGIGVTPPGMFTPTGLALNAIVDMLPPGMSLDPDVVPEPQIIVLATDGNPNDCMPADFMTPNYQPSIDA